MLELLSFVDLWFLNCPEKILHFNSYFINQTFEVKMFPAREVPPSKSLSGDCFSTGQNS